MAVAFGLGAGEVIVDSASQAAVPQLVARDQLDRANGQLISAMTVLDQVVGVALGAVLFSVAAGLPFAVDAASFIIGGALLASIRRPLQGERAVVTTSVRSDIAEGMRFLLGHRLLRGLMAAVSITNLAGNVSFGVLVVLVVDDLGASQAAFGLVLAARAVGGVVGSLVAARLTARLGRRRMLVFPTAVLIVTHLINATAAAAWVVSVSLFISSFAIVCFNVPGQTIRQAATPEPLLGRVVGSWRMIGLGAAPLGAMLGGFLTEALNVRIANVVAAGIGALAWVTIVVALRHLDDAIIDPHLAASPPSSTLSTTPNVVAGTARSANRSASTRSMWRRGCSRPAHIRSARCSRTCVDETTSRRWSLSPIRIQSSVAGATGSPAAAAAAWRRLSHTATVTSCEPRARALARWTASAPRSRCRTANSPAALSTSGESSIGRIDDQKISHSAAAADASDSVRS